MDDNRKHPRCSIHWRSAITIEENGKSETIQCKTNDISINGLSVICHRNVSVQETVTVFLLVDPGSHNHPQVVVEVRGQVMNNVFSGQQGGFRLGIQFTRFAGDGKAIMKRHLPQDVVRPERLATTQEIAPSRPAAPAENASPAPAQGIAPVADDAPTGMESPGDASSQS